MDEIGCIAGTDSSTEMCTVEPCTSILLFIYWAADSRMNSRSQTKSKQRRRYAAYMMSISTICVTVGDLAHLISTMHTSRDGNFSKEWLPT